VATPTIALAHGATSGPWVFDDWVDALDGWDVRVPDLQEGLDVAHASMRGYAGRLIEAAGGARPLVFGGWSMGGLVAMMAAAELGPAGLVVIEPSAPLEVAGGDHSVEPAPGTYEAEDVYGPQPAGTIHRTESLLARQERHRGISVPAVPCPLLVVAGRDHAEDRGRAIASHYGGDLITFHGLGHGALVRDTQPRGAVATWLGGLDLG
jgi:hypothetical protein